MACNAAAIWFVGDRRPDTALYDLKVLGRAGMINAAVERQVLAVDLSRHFARLEP